MSSRHDAIAAFYARKAAELQRAIRRAICGPDARVEDACSHAWLQLLRHPDVELSDRGFSWLYVVALHEGYRLGDRARREVAIDSTERLVGADAIDRTLHRERVELVRALPARKRELVLLHAAGFTYPEIARITGNSLRTVERQLLRGKRALRHTDRHAAAEVAP
jgi:RNA polymerase sigma factor (sigma-70 family)